jgi:hypothetical protein
VLISIKGGGHRLEEAENPRRRSPGDGKKQRIFRLVDCTAVVIKDWTMRWREWDTVNHVAVVRDFKTLGSESLPYSVLSLRVEFGDARRLI